MKTKYIKVSVSERLPQKEGRYFLWVDNPNARNLNSQKLSAEYNMERHFFKNGEFQTFYEATHYLEEVPDYEEEMLDMIEECRLQLEHLNSLKKRGTTNSVLSRLKTLLTKIK